MLIGGFARQVLKDVAQDPQKNQEKLQIIVDEVKRLEDFLVEVGSFARLSEPHLHAGDVNALIQELGQRLEPNLRERGLQLVVGLDPNLPLIMFDALHMRQVMLNLAKNGLEAMEEGGTLTITTQGQPDGIVVEFADTGAGIPPDILDKIFQPFYSTKVKGSGLGLAISQKIIEAHHGRITIDSEPAKGTRVRLFLRAEPPGS